MKNLLRYVCTILSLLVIAGLTASVARAQTGNGVVTGVIYDNSGAVIPHATVTLANTATDEKQIAVSDAAGIYRFAAVPVGDYTVTATAANFGTTQQNSVHVAPSQTLPLNFTLKPATQQQTVEVSSAPPLVQTASSDVTQTVNAATLDNTPLLSRNVYNLAFLAPEVTQGMDYNPTSGGQREASTTYLLNGSDNNDNFSAGNQNATPPLEAVGEFTMLTNDMSAQYGRGAGAVVSAVGKSGTNQWHGVAYEFNRNRSFNASDFFSNRNSAPKPGYVRNQFGFGIGGPIQRDKTFFYALYDGVTENTTNNSVAHGPTSAEWANLQTASGPLAQFYLKQYTPFVSDSVSACPDLVGTPAVGHVGCTLLVDHITNPQHNPYLTLDHLFSSGDRLHFSGTMNYGTYTDPFGGGHLTQKTVPYVDSEHYHNLTLEYTHVFTPNVLNDLLIGQNRHFSESAEGAGQAAPPEVTVNGHAYGNNGWGMGAYHSGVFVEFAQDRWIFQDNLSYNVGRHSFKFGGAIQPGNLYRLWDLGGTGLYRFDNFFGPTPQSLGAESSNGAISRPTGMSGSTFKHDSNLSNDFPYFEEFAIDPRNGQHANAYHHYTYHDANLFMQDDWKVSNRLTLNLGLRWDRYDPPSDTQARIAQFKNFNCLTSDLTSAQSVACVKNAVTGPAPTMWIPRNGDLGPRFGFAYDLFGDGRTSLRGGYGIYYDRIFDNIWSNGAWNPPFYALLNADASATDTIFYTNPASAVPTFVPQPDGQFPGRISIRTMENHLKDTSVDNYYLGIERQMGQNFLLRVDYQGSVGRHEPVLMNYNRYDGMGYNSTLTSVRPNKRYTGFNYRANSVNSSYNSLVTEIQKRMSNGMQFQFSYTWSKLMDYNSDLFAGSTTQGSYSQPFYYISNSHENLEKGAGAFDHMHNLKFNFIYNLPFFSSQSGILGHVLGGWQVNGFFQGYSGHPIEIYNGNSSYPGSALDANGIPENLGGDYNLDNVGNVHPNYVGSSIDAAYSHANPADGIFTDNNPIGCGFAGAQSPVGPTANTVAGTINDCNASQGVVQDAAGNFLPNKLFVNPAGTGVRFGTLGRNVFRSPWFNDLDASLFKNFKIGEGKNFQVRFETFNTLNHPNFDGIDTNLSDAGSFGLAHFLAGTPARRLQVGGRFTF